MPGGFFEVYSITFLLATVGLSCSTYMPRKFRTGSRDVNEARSIRDRGRGHKVEAKAEAEAKAKCYEAEAECYEAEARVKVD